MKCYYDPTREAIGICKSCEKGICADHATDLGKGLACKGRCEAQVQALIALIDDSIATHASNQNLIQGSGRAGMISSIFFLLMGVTFVVTSIRMWESRGLFLLVIGSLFIAWSLYCLSRSYSVHRSFSNASVRKR